MAACPVMPASRNQSSTFRERLGQPEVVIIDGALGTELERRGVPTPEPLWSASALLTHPDAIRTIHEEYIRAGAEVIIANTFRSNVRAVKRAGLAYGARDLTHLAVQLAREARENAANDSGPVWIAGSISPVEDCFSPHLVPPHETTRREHSLMAAWLLEAGVDVVFIETMCTIDEAVAAAEAVSGTGLPFCVGFTCGDDGRIRSGESLHDAALALAPFHPDALLVNCTATPFVTPALRELASGTSVPVGAYGNLGPPVAADAWELEHEITPSRYAAYTAEWIDIGARLVGGCCGTTPAYVAAVRAGASHNHPS